VSDLLADLAARDVRVWREGERLAYDAPEGAMTAHLLARLRAEKADILARLAASAATVSVAVYPAGDAPMPGDALDRLFARFGRFVEIEPAPARCPACWDAYDPVAGPCPTCHPPAGREGVDR
jgi:hypothetical protein